MNTKSLLAPKVGSLRKTTDCKCSSCQLFGRELTVRDLEDGTMTMSGLDDPAQLILKQDIVDLLNAYSEDRLPSSAHFRVKRILAEADNYIKNSKEALSSEYRKLSVEHSQLKERLDKELREHRGRIDTELREHRRRIDAERIEHLEGSQRIRKKIIAEYEEHEARMRIERLEHDKLVSKESRKIKAYPWLVAGVGLAGISSLILGIMLIVS